MNSLHNEQFNHLEIQKDKFVYVLSENIDCQFFGLLQKNFLHTIYLFTISVVFYSLIELYNILT